MTDKAKKYLSDIQSAIFRNRLIHSYDNIDNSIVWIIIKNHLPVLKGEIETILKPEN